MRRVVTVVPITFVLLGVAACGPTAPPPPPPQPWVAPPAQPPQRPTVAPTPAPLREAFPTAAGEPAERRVHSKRFQLGIHLPDRPGWVLRKERSRFLIFDHAASKSLLNLALWREDDNMSVAGCEEKARLWRDLPRRGKPIDERRLAVPRGFTTQLEAGFAESAAGEPIRGYLLAFGANARRCFAFSYATEADGPGAEQLVGDRLAVMRSVTLERLELESDIPR